MKRLIIYFFYDEQGTVDKYIESVLCGFRKNSDKTVTVCNGILQPAGRAALEKYSDMVIVRENQGYDVWAYKCVIDFLGWDELLRYDEIVFVNHTICGPLYPLEIMFSEMDAKDVDFWGLTEFHGGRPRPAEWPDNGYDTVQDHLQSHFIAVRRRMAESCEFRRYWEKLPPICSYNDSVALHESVFTKKFADMGFRYCAYVNTNDLRELSDNPIMWLTEELVKNRKCPFIKRKRNVYQPYSGVIRNNACRGYRELADTVTESSGFDMDLIYSNTLRTSELFLFQKGTETDNISSYRGQSEKAVCGKNISFVFYADDEKYAGCLKEHMSDVPDNADILLTGNKELCGEFAEAEFTDGEGRSGLYSIVEEKACKYDYVFSACFDTLFQHIPGSFDLSILNMQIDSIMESRYQTDFVIDTFEKNKLLGIMTPPVPVIFGDLERYKKYRLENREYTERFADFIGVKNSDQNLYFYPANDIFVCRSDAIKGFGSALRACFGDRKDLPYGLLLPLYAQSKGFYTGRVMTERTAAQHIASLEHMANSYG